MCIPIPIFLKDQQLSINFFNDQHSLFTQMLGYESVPFFDDLFDDISKISHIDPQFK